MFNYVSGSSQEYFYEQEIYRSKLYRDYNLEYYKNLALEVQPYVTGGTSGSTDPSVLTRITNLENQNFEVTYYTLINLSATTGSIVFPTNTILETSQFGAYGNSVVSTVDGSSKPLYKTPKSGNTIVTVNLSLDGTYTSNTIYGGDLALIYRLRVAQKDLTGLTQSRIIDYYKEPEKDYANTLFSTGTTFYFSASTSNVVIVNSSASTVITVYLPSINLKDGDKFIVKDLNRGSSGKPIKINASGLLIDGSNEVLMNIDKISLTFLYVQSTNEYIII